MQVTTFAQLNGVISCSSTSISRHDLSNSLNTDKMLCDSFQQFHNTRGFYLIICDRIASTPWIRELGETANKKEILYQISEKLDSRSRQKWIFQRCVTQHKWNHYVALPVIEV